MKTKRLKDTTKAELSAALGAADREIIRLNGMVTTLGDAIKFHERNSDSLTADLKTANDQGQELTAELRGAKDTVASLETRNQELESIITSLQDQVDQLTEVLKNLDRQGINPESIGCQLNLSALRRVLDASKANEPVFVLRARDMVAPGQVEAWAAVAASAGVTNSRKLGSALQRAADMRKWQAGHGCQIPD